jgi:hypothetical protein
MDRVLDEKNYVLSILRRTRDRIHEKPDSFDPSAEERVEEAIAVLEHADERACR